MSVCITPSLMCNMRHKFCYQDSFSDNRLPDKILYEGLKTLYPRIKLLGVLGGEITVIPGMKEYIKFIAEKYPKIKINPVTNGLEFDEEWIKLSCENNCIVNFSLDATNEATTSKILTKGNGKYYWDKIYGNFLKLVEAHEKQKNHL